MTARAVCGCHPPNLAPLPRDSLTIARDLYHAAEHLADIAEGFATGACDNATLSSADALLVGAGRLIVELRQRAQQPARPSPAGLQAPCATVAMMRLTPAPDALETRAGALP